MTDPTNQNPVPSEPQALASSPAASAPARTGFTLRGRKWIYGATLAAAGVLAGSGITYAVVNQTPTAQSQTFAQNGSGQRGGPMGAPPDGQPSGAPSAPSGGTA